MTGTYQMDRANGRWLVGSGYMSHENHEGLIEVHRYEDSYAVEVMCVECGETTWVPAQYWLNSGAAA